MFSLQKLVIHLMLVELGSDAENLVYVN